MSKKTVVKYEIYTNGAEFEVPPSDLNVKAGDEASDVVTEMKDANLSKVKLIDEWGLLYDEDVTIRVTVDEYEDGEVVSTTTAEW